MAKGDHAEAIRAYEEAVRRDPNKPEYAKALTDARHKVSSVYRDQAVAAESRGDWGAAERSWKEAASYEPDNQEWQARSELASLRAKSSDPVDYYRAALKLQKLRPNDRAIAASLAEAKDQATVYHLRLAATYADAKAYEEAYKEYEVAREIAPDQPAFTSPRYQHVSANHYELLGDDKMAAGDTVGAYQAYEQAQNVKKSASLLKKMANAKRGAGPVIELLNEADTLIRLGKWEEAADILSTLTLRKGTPPDTAQKALEARLKSSELKANRAQAYADRGLIDKAIAELGLALDHTDGPIGAMDGLRQAQQELEQGRPGAVARRLKTLDPATAQLAWVKVAPGILKATASLAYDKARALEARDPAEALVAIKELEPLSEKLPGYEAMVKNLTKKAFTLLLERAEARATEGEAAQASRLVRTALEVSQPPKGLADALAVGVASLEKGEWEAAHGTFTAAVTINGRSQLAKVGQSVARTFWLVELRRIAADAHAADDESRAASTYRIILGLDPNDAEAKAGIEVLKAKLIDSAMAAAEAHAAAGRVGAAFVYYRRVQELEPGHPEATAALEGLNSRLHQSDAPEAWVALGVRDPALGQACPGAEKTVRDRLALYLTRTPGLGASYLAHEAATQVEKGERPAPTFELTPIVTACKPVAKGGVLSIRWVLKLRGKVLAESVAQSTFDPTSIPKDELQAGLPAERVLGELVGGAAKVVSSGLKEQADRLKGWRALEVKEAIAKDDAESAARWYANLVVNPSLGEDERGALRDLERYVTVRFR